jgi:hypothetical protein
MPAMRNRQTKLLLLLLLGLLAAACGKSSPPVADSTANKQGSAKTPSTRDSAVKRDSSNGDDGSLPRAGTSAAAKALTAGASSSGDSVKKRHDPDSAELLVVATRVKGRTRRDSISLANTIRRGLKAPGWPVKGPDPLPGSLLPRKRIVAFYGNPLSKRMGVLGEYPVETMLAKLDTAVREWHAADPATPVQPALHLIVSVAQGQPGKDGMYRQRSDTGLIEKVYGWARSKNAILFLDIQAGKSTIDQELPRLLPYLARPDVHLGLDPEFYMHYNREGRTPGAKIGALDAKDVNHAIDELGKLVTKYRLPPKVLVIHRFTTNMLQNAEAIRLDPRVQVVINMDGWGQPWLKFDTYAKCEVAEPVQFTGFKLFFHNDTKKGDPLLTAREVLALRPRPLYIQYQ